MFQTIISWVRRFLGLFNRANVKRVLDVDAAISKKMSEAVELWSNMYNDSPPWLSDKVQTMSLPSMIASEIARLTTIEMVSDVQGSPRADYINEQYQKVVEDLRPYVEYGCAKGGLILKPYVSGDAIEVDYIQADKFIPTAFDSSGNITGAVFVDTIERGTIIYTRLEYHNLTDSGYDIKNVAFKSETRHDLGRQIDLTSVSEWAELQPETTIENVEIPLFAYFKFPQANTVDTDSPLGVSVYSRAVDLIKEADKLYSQLLWEFESGERAVFADSTAFKKDKKGNPVLPHKRLYRIILGALDKGGKMYDGWSPEFREQNILNGLDAILAKIEDVCGLARGTISNPQAEVRTATELKILKQRSYATVVDTQKALKKALNQLIAAMDIFCTLYSLAPKGNIETKFEFDDSIVADRPTEFDEKLKLFQNGIYSAEKMLAWYEGISVEEAKKELPDMAEEMPQ